MKNLQIKSKIILMPLMTLAALLILLAITKFFTDQNESLLSQIENGHFPALEMNRDLVEILAAIQRKMQDAVVSEDREMLERVAVLKDSFITRLQAGKTNSTVDLDEVKELEKSFSNYYDLAIYVSKQMILGNFNEEMTKKIGQMTTEYKEISSNLLESTMDRKQSVVKAFATSRGNQGTSILAILLINVFLIILLAAVSIFLIRSIIGPLNKLLYGAKKISNGKYDVHIYNRRSDEIGMLSSSFNEMAQKVKRSISDVETQNWLKSGQSELSDKIRGDLDLKQIAGNVINYLANYVNAHVGIMYFKAKKDSYESIASYAFQEDKKSSFKVGDNLLGQAVTEKKSLLITDVPKMYLDIGSGLGIGKPKNIVILPLIYNNQVNGVIELGSLNEFTPLQISFLEQASENIAIALHAAQAKIEMRLLLDASQEQSKMLHRQKEELAEINNELQAEKTNTDNIFRNVNEGIFLLKKDLCIKPHYSLVLEKILSQEKLGDKNFVNILKENLKGKVLNDIEDFLSLMLNSDVEESNLENLNPLIKLKMESDSIKNRPEVSYLSFRFKRIFDVDGNISELLSTVTDISEEVKLGKNLEDSLKLKQKDIEWLLNILHIPRAELEIFLEIMQTSLEEMDKILENTESEEQKDVLIELRKKIEPAIEEAMRLEIRYFINKANEFVSEITSIESREQTDGKDFLSLIMILSDLKIFEREINNLAKRMGEPRVEAAI